MNKTAIALVSLLALLVLGALPWLWQWSAPLGWACAIAICAWVPWSIWSYLNWARTLGTLGRTSPPVSQSKEQN